ncbi:MAG TPA: ATP-binding protein [Actinomycetota bacterium]|nr:ATP-binding protein [Actinomycetota bacterium]
MRLELRVTAWLLALLGASAAAALAGGYWFEARAVDRQAREVGRLVALSVRNSLEVSMLNNAPEDIRRAVTNVGRGTYVRSVAVYRGDGTVWVSSEEPIPGHPSGALRRVVEDGRTRTVLERGLATVLVPVLNRPECGGCHQGAGPVLGTVGVVLDERPLRDELLRGARNSLVVAALPLAIGVAASIWAVRRWLLRPLAMVGSAAERVASGDLGTRLPELRGREFASVVRAFNEMTARLERQAADLERTVEQLRSDLEGMEEIQSLVARGAGLGEILSRTAGHLARALAASGVEIRRPGADGPRASWGEVLPPPEAALRPPTEARSSAGPLEAVDEGTPLRWVVAPAARGGRPLALLGVAWDPPRPLGRPERDLLASVAGLVAVAIENAELLERLREEEQALEGTLKKTLAAQEEERRRVARELHDDASQLLHALLMNLGLLEDRVVERPIRERLRALKALAEQASRNLEKLLLDLRPALLDELGLVAALRWYVSQAREAWEVPIELEVSRVPRLPSHVETAAFRIVQEAVGNALRHARPRTVRVRVGADGERLAIAVEDDGSGFDVAAASARARRGEVAGLLGMRERAELLGGVLRIESSPGSGTKVWAEIPLPRTEGGETRDGREDQGARR